MSDINKVIIVGRLTADPVLKETTGGNKICTINIAVDQSHTKDGNKTEKVSFFEAVAWSKLGEVIAKYVLKGHKFGFVGHAEQQRWKNDTGESRSKVVFVIEEIQFLQPKSEGSNSGSVKDQFNGETQEYGFPDPFNENIPF